MYLSKAGHVENMIYKLIVGNLAVSINISLSNHLLHLLVSQLLPQVGHHVTQLGGADEAVAVLVEHPEGFSDLFLARMEIFVI